MKYWILEILKAMLIPAILMIISLFFILEFIDARNQEISRVVRAYEEALKIRTVEKYPLYYEIVVSNMSEVKQRMKAEHQ